jgi:pimeloyl-ACP methyl ester carboxylesterase
LISRAIAKLGVERFNLIGHSLGADLALSIGIENPQPIDAIIGIAPTAICPPAEAYKGAPYRSRAYTRETDWYRAPGASESTQAEARARDEQFEANLAKIATPVMVIFGTADEIVSTSAARLYSELLPKCFPILVYDASHDVELERPDAIAAAARNFLEHREGFVVNRDDAMINP